MTESERDLLTWTQELWSGYYGRPITDEEAKEIIRNVVRFAEVLLDWCRTDSASVDRFLEARKASSEEPKSTS